MSSTEPWGQRDCLIAQVLLTLAVSVSSSCPILDSCSLISMAFLLTPTITMLYEMVSVFASDLPVSLQTHSEFESSGSSGIMGFPLSKMVERFEPNSVGSWQREQRHQKFLVRFRWSLRAMEPQRAWVYMVEMCSPSGMSLAAFTVIWSRKR